MFAISSLRQTSSSSAAAGWQRKARASGVGDGEQSRRRGWRPRAYRCGRLPRSARTIPNRGRDGATCRARKGASRRGARDVRLRADAESILSSTACGTVRSAPRADSIGVANVKPTGRPTMTRLCESVGLHASRASSPTSATRPCAARTSAVVRGLHAIASSTMPSFAPTRISPKSRARTVYASSRVHASSGDEARSLSAATAALPPA